MMVYMQIFLKIEELEQLSLVKKVLETIEIKK